MKLRVSKDEIEEKDNQHEIEVQEEANRHEIEVQEKANSIGDGAVTLSLSISCR